jgi:hypothetical protein
MKPILLTFLILNIHPVLFAQNNNNSVTHFNHVLFTIPTGWVSNQQGGFFEMHPSDLDKDEMLTYLFLPPVTDTSFANVALQTINEMATGVSGESYKEDVYGNSPLYQINNQGIFIKGWEYSTGRSHIRLKHSINAGIIDYWFYYLGIFMVKIHNRIERVVFMSKDLRRGLDQNSTYRKPAYENIVRDFFYSLEFDDWTAANYKPGKVTNTGISHLWGGASYFEGATGSTFNVGSMQGTYLVFFDNGQVFLNAELPQNGFNNIDTYVQAATYPRWWGTYTYKEGSGVIKLSYETIPFKLEKGQINLNHYQTSIPYAQMPSLDGVKLSGSWCMQGSFGGKTICLNLGPDGRFNDNGVIHYLEHNINNCFAGAPQAGEGTYEIKNNSILFHYNNGAFNQAGFSGLRLQSSNPSPKEIHLGYHDDVFQKQ